MVVKSYSGQSWVPIQQQPENEPGKQWLEKVERQLINIFRMGGDGRHAHIHVHAGLGHESSLTSAVMCGVERCE